MYTKKQVVRAARRMEVRFVDFLSDYPEEMSTEQFRDCVEMILVDSTYWDGDF